MVLEQSLAFDNIDLNDPRIDDLLLELGKYSAVEYCSNGVRIDLPEIFCDFERYDSVFIVVSEKRGSLMGLTYSKNGKVIEWSRFVDREEAKESIIVLLRKLLDLLEISSEAGESNLFDDWDEYSDKNSLSKLPDGCHLLDGAIADIKCVEQDIVKGTTNMGNICAAFAVPAIGKTAFCQDRVGISNKDVFVVADGVSGSDDGGVSAQVLTNVLLERMPFSSPEDIPYALTEVFRRLGNDNVSRFSATCFTACYISEENGHKYYNVFSLGDCRAFIKRKNGQIIQITRDHTYVQDVIDYACSLDSSREEYVKDLSLFSTERHKISKSLCRGHINSKYESDFFVVECLPGDRLFLASDGLTDNLTNEEVVYFTNGLNGFESLSELSRILEQSMKQSLPYWREYKKYVEYRKENGVFPNGRKCLPKDDDIGVIVVDIPDKDLFSGFDEQNGFTNK